VNRAYSGPDDLRRMQALLASHYAETHLRVGDLAWLVRAYTQPELTDRIRLWADELGELRGWTFHRDNGGFNIFPAPDLLSEMLNVIDKAGGKYTYAIDLSRPADRALAEALRERGFQAMDDSTCGVLTRDLTTLPAVTAPPGYQLTTVTDVQGRVEAQQAAFAPSTMTIEQYQRVRATWPYRTDLDIVARRDERTVAFCTAWLDETNAAGVLEPVGTDPAHQRKGLAHAVCLAALHALRAAGARTAQVSHASAAARALYESLGFRRSGQDLTMRRP